MPFSRRSLMKAGATFLGGTVVGGGALAGRDALRDREGLPVYGGYASAVHADRRTPPHHPQVAVCWGGVTTSRRVALTFDDGPMPHWTPRVLDLLDEHQVPATFFMIGQRAHDHWGLVAGRLDAHEVGNHTWNHHDLAKLDDGQVTAEIHRAHAELTQLSGRQPTLLRPPYGHLGGATLLAAADLNYSVVLWNLQMLESEYPHAPAGLASHLVDAVTPGTILLAHDTGHADRQIGINALPDLIPALKARGYTFVTVSELLRDAPAGTTV